LHILNRNYPSKHHAITLPQQKNVLKALKMAHGVEEEGLESENKRIAVSERNRYP